jgi:nicotinamide riboside kinase
MTPRPPRVALSGSAGTGKTTLGCRLAERWGVPFVAEGMRTRLEAGLDLHAFTHDDLADLLHELFAEQEAAVADALAAAGGYVADRSPIDHFAFWLYYGFGGLREAETEAVLDRVLAARDGCDAIVLLPWGALALEDDGIRSANPWRQLHFQALVEGLSLRHMAADRLLWLPAAVTDPAARVAWVEAELAGRGCLRVCRSA